MNGPSQACQQPPFNCLKGLFFQWENGNAYIEKMSGNILSIRVGTRVRTEQWGKNN